MVATSCRQTHRVWQTFTLVRHYNAPAIVATVLEHVSENAIWKPSVSLPPLPRNVRPSREPSAFVILWHKLAANCRWKNSPQPDWGTVCDGRHGAVQHRTREPWRCDHGAVKRWTRWGWKLLHRQNWSPSYVLFPPQNDLCQMEMHTCACAITCDEFTFVWRCHGGAVQRTPGKRDGTGCAGKMGLFLKRSGQIEVGFCVNFSMQSFCAVGHEFGSGTWVCWQGPHQNCTQASVRIKQINTPNAAARRMCAVIYQRKTITTALVAISCTFARPLVHVVRCRYVPLSRAACRTAAYVFTYDAGVQASVQNGLAAVPRSYASLPAQSVEFVGFVVQTCGNLGAIWGNCCFVRSPTTVPGFGSQQSFLAESRLRGSLFGIACCTLLFFTVLDD